MSVDPLKSRALPSTEPSGVARGEQARQQEGSVEEQTSDAPQVTANSTRASSGLTRRVDEAVAVPQGTLSLERMQTVLRRLADGFYDRAPVRMEVARRVGPDIDNSSTE